MLKIPTSVLLTLWFMCFGIFLLFAAVPVDIDSQIMVGLVIMALLSTMQNRNLRQYMRVFFLILAAYLSLRYFFWRTFNTISFNDPLSFAAALALYLAEIYGMTVYFLGIFVNIQPLHRQSVPLPEDSANYPSVDIMIPSYNEDPEMLEITLMAALQVRYPKDKLRVCLLDDGGTVNKRNDKDPQKKAAAWHRFYELQALCERLGAVYLTRELNNHAKAGNINAALDKTDGELVLILDADHVPTADILEKTVGLFIQDPKLFLVQTPHFFISPDPVEKNLEVFGHMPSENEMFYSVIQPGLDFWDASFFCGSAAVLRRKYLMEVGGISGTSITEDAETALEMHTRGYHSAYINRPMVSGLQPETYTGFVVQRVRWAQGMVQIFLLKNPWRVKGLKIWQRLGYMSSSFFWFFAYARTVFLLAPTAYLIFGLHIYDANLQEFLGYAVPHIVAAMMVSNYLFGKVRWAFISELYEIMQSLFALPGIIKVFRNPRAPTFMVTPKGEQLDDDFISTLSKPFYAIYVITVIALLMGVYRLWSGNPDSGTNERDVTLITMGWEFFNLILLNAAIGALYERRQRRTAHRMPANLEGHLLLPGLSAISCRINDLSVGGALLLVSSADAARFTTMMTGDLLSFNPSLNKFMRPPVKIRSMRTLEDGNVAIGAEFGRMPQSEFADMVSFVHGDSQRWVDFQERRKIRLGIFQAFWWLLKLGFKYAYAHFFYITRSGVQFIYEILSALVQWLYLFLATWVWRVIKWIRAES
jgi:cellulose synthase (UDP-forming)